MAKRYDPILCMLVDEPTKAQDELKIKKEDGLWCVYKDGKVIGQSNSEAGALRLYRMFESKAQDAMPSDLKKAGYEVGTVEKYGSTYYTLVYNGKVISTSPTEANIVEKAKKHYANRHGKAQDSASALDEAIKTCDGMFQQIFGKYSSAAKQHYDRAVKELDSFKGEIKDYLTLAGKWEMQIRNDLTRIDEAYNAAGNDYYAARREIQETMDSLTQVMLRKAREKRK